MTFTSGCCGLTFFGLNFQTSLHVIFFLCVVFIAVPLSEKGMENIKQNGLKNFKPKKKKKRGKNEPQHSHCNAV